MARLLLILPTDTYRTADFMAAARRVGAEVVVASERAQALAAGDDYLQLDFRDPVGSARAVVELARRRPLDAVIPVDDRGVLVAALAGQALGLVHNPPEAVAATRDKAEMRRRLARAGVSQPDFAVARASDDVAAVAARLGLPCVVKPLSLSGSRGVIRADDPQGAAGAAARIRAILAEAGEDPAGELLVERYVPGMEVAVEGLLRDGELEVLAIFDKPDPLEGPYFEETIYVTPSRLPAATQRRIALLTREAAAALGLREGPLHAEVRLDGGRLWLLEVAARSIGGLCSRTLRFGLVNRSLEAILVRHALRMPLHDLRREEVSSGVMMLPIPGAGTLQEVRGREEALAVPGIVDLEMTIPAGRPVRPLPEGDRYLGFLFARGPTPQAVEASLREAHRRLEVLIDP
ncbi:MAG: ATP-grasp domain-containing protein [Acidimicrobiia bacterium]